MVPALGVVSTVAPHGPWAGRRAKHTHRPPLTSAAARRGVHACILYNRNLSSGGHLPQVTRGLRPGSGERMGVSRPRGPHSSALSLSS